MNPVLQQLMSEQSSTKRRAILAGATGLVGSELLKLLLKEDSIDQVKVLVRKTLDMTDPKLEVSLVEYERLMAFADVLEAEDIFSCLGTTMKKAGSREAFELVDFEYVRKIARLSLAKGARRFYLVSAIGANAASPIFYNRIKGKIEDELLKMPFEAVHIFRPSVLVGSRGEARFAEDLGAKFLDGMGPLVPKRLRPVRVTRLAEMMLKVSKSNKMGKFIYENEHIQELKIED